MSEPQKKKNLTPELRILVASLLSMGVILVWTRFFSPKPPDGLLSILGGSVDIHGPTDFYGWALAGPSGIKRVEISIDEGASWSDAEILDNRSPYIWTIWKYRFRPAQSGSMVIRVRATDGNGAAQLLEDQQAGEGISSQARMTLKVSL